MPILVKPLYTTICKLIQILVLPLYIKTIIGMSFCSLFLFSVPPAGAVRTAGAITVLMLRSSSAPLSLGAVKILANTPPSRGGGGELKRHVCAPVRA